MSLGKFAIATAVLVGVFAGCEWYATLIPPTHWAYAIFTTFIFLAVATALVTALELPVLPRSHFAAKPIERDGKVYRWAGIQALVGFLRIIGWERMWRKQNPVRNDAAALRQFAESTRGAEAVHVVAGVLSLGLTVSIGLRYSWPGTVWLWLTNGIVNLYPVMLQRHNRPRAERLIQRLEREKGLPR